MMFGNATPKKAITFTKYCVILCCGWPLPSSASKRQFYGYLFLKVVCALLNVAVFLPALWSLYLHIDDPVITGNTFGLACAILQIFTNIIICTIQHNRYQRLIEEMTNYLDKAEPHEMAIFQRYVDKYSTYHGISTLFHYCCATVVVVATFFLEQPFPVVTEYPFRVDYEPIRTIIFLNHSFLCFQGSSSISLNTLTSLLLLFAAARFDILMLHLGKAVTVADLKKCMNMYYDVKRYAHDVVGGIQYITLSTILLSSIMLVNCGLNIIGHLAFAVKCQFTFVAVTALLEVFTCVLPADRLIEASEGAIRSAYNLKWYERDLSVQKMIYRMMVRLKPIVVSFVYVIPQLSLDYYCSYSSDRSQEAKPSTSQCCAHLIASHGPIQGTECFGTQRCNREGMQRGNREAAPVRRLKQREQRDARRLEESDGS
ncbi:uncharacterized protein LOC143259913 isoform X2 [Megalopta genalis]|uniref:uncharacterized protein LOC143259913 isoform X2 n=1 Tax=Megalopta genalis TaxID=115081 RepID=UPI003FCF0A1B